MSISPLVAAHATFNTHWVPIIYYLRKDSSSLYLARFVQQDPTQPIPFPFALFWVAPKCMLELAFAHDPTDNSLVILTKTGDRRLGKEPLKNKEFGEVAHDVARRYIGSPNWYDAAMSVEFKLYPVVSEEKSTYELPLPSQFIERFPSTSATNKLPSVWRYIATVEGETRVTSVHFPRDTWRDYVVDKASDKTSKMFELTMSVNREVEYAKKSRHKTWNVAYYPLFQLRFERLILRIDFCPTPDCVFVVWRNDSRWYGMAPLSVLDDESEFMQRLLTTALLAFRDFVENSNSGAVFETTCDFTLVHDIPPGILFFPCNHVTKVLQTSTTAMVRPRVPFTYRVHENCTRLAWTPARVIADEHEYDKTLTLQMSNCRLWMCEKIMRPEQFVNHALEGKTLSHFSLEFVGDTEHKRRITGQIFAVQKWKDDKIKLWIGKVDSDGRELMYPVLLNHAFNSAHLIPMILHILDLPYAVNTKDKGLSAFKLFMTSVEEEERDASGGDVNRKELMNTLKKAIDAMSKQVGKEEDGEGGEENKKHLVKLAEMEKEYVKLKQAMTESKQGINDMRELINSTNEPTKARKERKQLAEEARKKRERLRLLELNTTDNDLSAKKPLSEQFETCSRCVKEKETIKIEVIDWRRCVCECGCVTKFHKECFPYGTDDTCTSCGLNKVVDIEFYRGERLVKQMRLGVNKEEEEVEGGKAEEETEKKIVVNDEEKAEKSNSVIVKKLNRKQRRKLKREELAAKEALLNKKDKVVNVDCNRVAVALEKVPVETQVVAVTEKPLVVAKTPKKKKKKKKKKPNRRLPLSEFLKISH